ncbi:hypothetical protein BJY52DRAFT_1269236 [Lactarius psammicola]|nr:hypothetical protein BJY52DRAFT_1269236 [Lactarius psammicola]
MILSLSQTELQIYSFTTNSFMMQRFIFILLAASVAILGVVVPVEAALLGKRGTKGQRIAGGPLPRRLPVRRFPEAESLAARKHARDLPDLQGRLEVARVEGDVLGLIANDPTRGPVGINLDSDFNPPNPNLIVTLSGLSPTETLQANNPTFNAPFFIGGSGTNILSPNNTNTNPFINIDAANAAVWSLDESTGLLNATWTNPDNTTIRPTLIYDADSNVLSLTANPTGLFNLQKQIPVSLSLVALF